MPSIKFDTTLMRLTRDVNEIKSALRRVTSNLPLYDIANENTPAALSTDQNDYVPGNYDVLKLSSSQDISITGIANGKRGRFLRIINIGSFEISFSHQSALSQAENRIISPTTTDILLTPDDQIVFYYDATQERWISSYSTNSDRISCKLRLSANLTVSNATYTSPDWTAVVDTGGFFDVAIPEVITIPETGWYEISCTLGWDTNGIKLRELYLQEEDSLNILVADSRLAVSDADTIISIGRTIYLQKGIAMRVLVWQNSGGDLDVLRASHIVIFTEFNVVKAN